jgi:CHAT domain-containing protein
LLPVGNTGRHLIEDKRISYVSSGREVVRLAEPRTSVPTNAPVVMGFPDFDLSLAAANGELAGQQARPDSAAAFVAVRTPATLSRDARGHHFDPLPATEREARSAAKLLGEDCVLLLGFAAREAELKRVVSPRILHLATHGFYVTDQEFRATNSLPDLLASSAGPRFGRRPVNEDWENPLIRCGVALAGANHAGGLTNATAEDGILTGLEASLLQLQGTELVILSACQTGAGDVRIGEGVMSLRRAFTIAGAQSVLASHWRVSDEATSRLITEFLRHWRAGKPRVEALREAQLALLRSKEYSSPYFWAAFTLTGQWR